MADTDVEARLRTALTTLILDEYSLLENIRLPLPASERVVAHQIGWRLRTEWDRSWDVDVEYNRVGHGTSPTVPSPDPQHRPVDISVHHRGLRGPAHNLLVVQLKVGGIDSLHAEVNRLRLTADHYRYRHGVLLDLGLEVGADPASPPVVVCPSWLWLDAETTDLIPVYRPEAARQLSRDGWQARQRRYPWDSDDEIEYPGWRTPEALPPEPTDRI
jgi:hypothetical protein